ncbi:hypothetical protein C468_13636 [Halorubrum kocurii JCM 14978]|uniref:Uncharacterized protein n=2 Tax=Halorubrum kocurii TaxID=478441 RepID=M0NQ53_9EURY|nr:hypothetical protein C468_13636 [Halorubrum kocurii JCM 14978]
MTVSTVYVPGPLLARCVMSDTDPSTTADPSRTLDRDTVRSASRIALAAGALVAVLYLFTLLPGMRRIVPFTPVTFAAAATAVATVAAVALLAVAAPKFASLTRLTLHRSGAAEHVETVAENAGAMVYWLVVLAAVLVAHRGLAGVVTPLLDGLAWTYDAAFLIAALVPLVFVVARLTVTIDPLSVLVADRVAGPETDGESAGAEATPVDDEADE